jgi:hypothetical protein
MQCLWVASTEVSGDRLKWAERLTLNVSSSCTLNVSLGTLDDVHLATLHAQCDHDVPGRQPTFVCQGKKQGANRKLSLELGVGKDKGGLS